MVSRPGNTPDTTPEAPTVAVAGLVERQVPPVAESMRVSVEPGQTTADPPPETVIVPVAGGLPTASVNQAAAVPQALATV